MMFIPVLDHVENEDNTLYLPVRVARPSSSWEDITESEQKKECNENERSIINLLSTFTEPNIHFFCYFYCTCAYN
jgi:hypothetical protein